MALDIRQRSGFLFLAVMLGHVILISAQVNARTGVPILEAVTFGVFAQMQRAVSAGTSGVRRVWSGYVSLRHLKTENDDLKRQLADAQVDLQRQRALADRSRGLERLLGLRDQSKLTTAAAGIIAAGATPDFRTVTIDKGSRDGLRADMAVIAPAGVASPWRARAPRKSSCWSIATPPPGRSSSAPAHRASSLAVATSGCAWTTSPRRPISRSATSS
jgi:rod shape-determining protein MreC